MSEPGISPRYFSSELKERIILRLEGGEKIELRRSLTSHIRLAELMG